MRARRVDRAPIALARPLHKATVLHAQRLEGIVGKYVIAWLLGVPLSLLVVIYLASHTFCG
jgi:hypothetical protein